MYRIKKKESISHKWGGFLSPPPFYCREADMLFTRGIWWWFGRFPFAAVKASSLVADRVSVAVRLVQAGHCLCVCGWCAHVVLTGAGDSLPRNCCCCEFLPRNCYCLKFQQSWNWTKQALPWGCACGKGKSDVTRGKINFHVLEVCLTKLQ